MSGRAVLIEQLLDSHFKSYILLAYDREGSHCSAVRFENQLEFDALATALQRKDLEFSNVIDGSGAGDEDDCEGEQE